MTGFTFHVNIGQEIHFNCSHTRSFTGFATPAFHIKTKTSGFITPNHTLRSHCKQISNLSKYFGIGRRIRPWRSPNGTLVNVNHFVDMFQAFNLFVRFRFSDPIEIISVQNRVEGFINQCRFSASRNSGHANHFAQRQFYRYIFKVVSGRSSQFQEISVALTTFFRNLNFHFSIQVGSRQSVVFQNFVRCSFTDDLATVFSRFRTYINHVIGTKNHVFIVFDHNDRVANIAQLFQRMNQFVVVSLV